MKRDSHNPWKYLALGLMGLGAATIAGVVVANYNGGAEPQDQRAARVSSAPSESRSRAYDAPARDAAVKPSLDAVRICNEYASTDKAKESFKHGLIGSALGAALGAAGGAIADGGSGAGKGAGIGALVGAAGGSLYGLNKANQEDQRSIAAYHACMEKQRN